MNVGQSLATRFRYPANGGDENSQRLAETVSIEETILVVQTAPDLITVLGTRLSAATVITATFSWRQSITIRNR